jgi:hypothetical protein
MLLARGERAVFKTYGGRLVTGTVAAVLPMGSLYLVAGDGEYCTTYGDSLFRFRDRDIVRILCPRRTPSRT